MTNKYVAPCAVCGTPVPPGTGTLVKARRGWEVYCLAHSGQAPRRGPRIITTTFSSGATVYRNARGRCEDAPCCGCCS